MTRLPIYQVDAFTSLPFRGNPAAVVPLENWLPDTLLQNIALENNLAETAFFVPRADGEFELRWFTPVQEAPICGHATLATAWVMRHRLGYTPLTLTFHNPLAGTLRVRAKGDWLELDFPRYEYQRVFDFPDALLQGLGVVPLEVYHCRIGYFCLLESESAVRAVQPSFPLLETLHPNCTIIMAPGDECDFVSRDFAPGMGIPEDPVTGSNHCVLTPLWAEKLNKLELHARQVSARGGDLWCKLEGDRVLMAGQVAPYLEGFIEVPLPEENRALE
jgi:PhzF family phenazine biosynthesis protein